MRNEDWNKLPVELEIAITTHNEQLENFYAKSKHKNAREIFATPEFWFWLEDTGGLCEGTDISVPEQIDMAIDEYLKGK